MKHKGLTVRLMLVLVLVLLLALAGTVGAQEEGDSTTPPTGDPVPVEYVEGDGLAIESLTPVIRVYKDTNAWFGENRDNATLLSIGKTLGTDYFIDPISACASGIPAGTSVVFFSSNGYGYASARVNQNLAACQASLAAFLDGGGVVVVDMGDNDLGGGYLVPGAAGTANDVLGPSDATCRDMTLASGALGPDLILGTSDDHPMVKGPDGIAGTADDLNNSNIDMAVGCYGSHGYFPAGMLPAGATLLMTRSFDGGATQQPIMAEYCYNNVGRVIVDTLTKESSGHPPPGTGPTRFLINLLTYALSPAATCNQPPVADPNGPYIFPLDAGPFDGTDSSDPDDDELTYNWDFGDGGTGTGATPSHTYNATGIYDVCLTVNDGQADSAEVCTIAVIYDPSAGFVTGGGWIDSPYGALRLPTDLPFFEGSYYELVETAPGLPWTSANEQANAAVLEGCEYPHLVTITSQEEQDALYGFFDGALQGKWYGGFQDEGETDPAAGWNWVTGELWDYTNWAPGEPNDAGGPGTEPHLIGWDGGWAWNDEGNLGNVTGYVVEYEQCGPIGKATFGFVSKYKKGATVPEGNTEFQFHAAGLNFHSSSYEWLVVTGSNYAMFKGVGTINGMGEYKFKLWAGDDDSDTFRIKIWEEVDGVETVIYDNGMDQPIAGGSIVIHTKK